MEGEVGDFAELKIRLEEKERELEEFRLESKEYEAELEAELAEFQSTKIKVEQLEEENSRLREKLQAINIELSEVSGKFEHATVVHIEDKLRLEKRILELEQMVDELERGRRADQAALQSTEGRLSSTLEQMALMGTELETKAQLEMDMQRARDELRDCKNEIEALRARQLTSDTIEHPSEDTVMKEPSQSNENTQEILACLKSLEERLLNCRSFIADSSANIEKIVY